MRCVRIFVVVTVVAAMAGTMACRGGPLDKTIKTSPIEKGPGTTQAARKFLEGRWSLISFEVFPPGKPPIVLKGAGSLVYDSYGNLKMELRPDDATAELLATAGIPVKDRVIMQEGRVVVDLQNRTLTYVIPGDLAAGGLAGPLAINRPRHWEVEGNILTLTTKDNDGKTLSVGRWQKEQ